MLIVIRSLDHFVEMNTLGGYYDFLARMQDKLRTPLPDGVTPEVF